MEDTQRSPEARRRDGTSNSTVASIIGSSEGREMKRRKPMIRSQ
jgi:hypothetical protein